VRIAQLLLVAWVLGALFACASPRPDVVGAPFGGQAAAPSGLGRVYVYRTGSGSGRSDEMVYVDGKFVGQIGFESSVRGPYCEFLFVDLNPGTHRLSTGFQGALEKIGMQLEVRAGEQYFVQVEIGSTALAPGPSMDVLTNQMTETYHRIALASEGGAPRAIRRCYQTLAVPKD